MLAIVAGTSAAWASDTEVGGIWYDFNNSTLKATITYRGSDYYSYSNEYSGSIIIPPSVTYDSKTYKVTSIGEMAFRACSGIETLTLGGSVSDIGASAFSGCSSITDIYCYAQRVPDVPESALDRVSRKAYLWVPANRTRNYEIHNVWGEFPIHALTAEGTETDAVSVTPGTNTADIVLPSVTGAATYELVIRNKDGNVICTLIFDAKGQLTSIAFSAPSRGNAPDNGQTAGFTFTVIGLNSNSSYSYDIVAKDSGNGVIDTKHGTFKTKGTATDIEETDGESGKNGYSGTDGSAVKVMRDGVTYIVMPDGSLYDLQGKEVR